MPSRIARVILLCLFAPVLAAPAVWAQDPGIADTVRIDSVSTFTNSTAIVPIRFFNDEALGGLEVTIRFSSPDVRVDSFSFTGGRLQFYSVKGTFAPPGAYSIYCIPFSGESPVPTGNGLLGQLYLSWDIDIVPQVVTIDTVTVNANDVVYATSFSTTSAVPFKPRSRRGYVDIQQGFGCCIGMRGNVDGDLADNVNVADLTALVSFLFRGAAPADCPTEADLDGLSGPDPNVADVTYLVSYLFRGGPAPVACQ